jgi:FkbM family methyltransferase
VRKLGRGDIFIDLGACVGAYTLFAAKKVGEKGKVIAVEPELTNFTILSKRCSKYNNVVLVWAAISNVDGYGNLFISPTFHGSHTLLRARAPKSQKCLSVPLKTIDSLIAEHSLKEITLLKLDIEGTELEAIKAADHALSITRSIVISVHDIDEIDSLEKLMIEKGFCLTLFRKPPLLIGYRSKDNSWLNAK